MKDKRVLVTGGAGFIGSHLVDALHAQGAEVRVLDDLSSGRRENLAAAGAELLEGDIRDLETCRRACAGADVVFHLAARGSVPRSLADPATTFDVNVSGTSNVFTAARDEKARRVVYASSSSVYGDAPALPKREGEEGRPLSPYALSKSMNESLARVFASCFAMELAGARFFNVYGPRQDPEGPYAAVVPRFFKAYRAGEAPVIHGDGLQSRDFTYVEDAVQALLLAAEAPRVDTGLGYNVAGGAAVTVNELAERIRALSGGGPEPVHAPERAGDVRHSLADLSRSARDLGYAPRVGLDEGLLRTAAFYARERAAA